MGISRKQLGFYAVLLAIGGGAGWVFNYITSNRPTTGADPNTTSPVVLPAAEPVVRRSEPGSANFIAAAVDKVGPAVVRIDASRTVSSSSDSFANPLRRFFEDDSQMPLPDRIEQGTGSGFIVSTDGHVVTNAHVVEGANVVKVTLRDGRSFEGRVVGIDRVTDVAAIKIEADGLPTVTLGSSKALVPGQWAIAIGNPLGLDNTVTAGIISAIDRSSSQVGIPDRRVQFIQTDAAINPGNSGGPLLNDRGEVIGINTAIRADAQGLGFAIPIETGWRIAQQLFESGRVEHPYLGIQMIDLTPELRQRINGSPELGITVNAERGVLVIQVMPDAPAAAAGIQPGDIILKINNVAVETAAALQQQIETVKVGDIVVVEVQRDNQTRTVQVRPIAFPSERAG